MELYGDYVQEACAASGTADYTLGGPPASSPYVSAVANFTTGKRVVYFVISDVTFKWESGWGIVTDGSPDTLTRNVKKSWDGVTLSDSAKISWGGADGALRMFCAPAAWVINGAVTHHRGTTAPDAPIAGMIWEDITSVTAVVWKHYDGTDWITLPWVINETANTVSIGAVTLAGAVAVSSAAQPGLLAGLVTFQSPGHRLSLTTAVPVTVADVTAAGTIYWTPDKHNVSPVYNGTAWILAAVAEKSFILDTGNHLSGKNYDAFLDYNAGTPRIVTGPAWTNDTTRADAISRDATYGWYVNTSSMTARISNNGGTVSIAAGAGLYLGTFRCSANGQIEDSLAKRFVWNNYNRRPRAMRVAEATNSWTWSTGSFQQANASAANQLAFVRGLNEDPLTARVLAIASSSTASARQVIVGIGIDSTSAASGERGIVTTASDGNRAVTASYSGFPGLGYHFAAWLEYGAGADTQTWLGDNGSTVVQTGISGEMMA